jgi:hypothetical protein
MMKLYSFAALAVLGAASADTSVLKFRNGGLVEEITWDGTSLIVPQLCRASECAALAATDVQQATTNGVLASHIAGASERAQVTAKGVVDANTKLIEQDKANAIKFQAFATSTITHGSKQRADFASDDAAIANTLKLETNARKQAVVSLEQSVAEETKALRKRHSTLEEMLLAAVERLDTFEGTVKTDFSGLRAVDTEDRDAAHKYEEDYLAADLKVQQATAALEAKLDKQHKALRAVDAALRAVDAEADAANTKAHEALRVLDDKLKVRIKAAEDKHDKDVLELRDSDLKLVAADDLAKKRVDNLRLDLEAKESLLATKIAQAVSDRDEKVALLKAEDARLNEAGGADQKSLLKLAEDVDTADKALAAKITELRNHHDSDVAKLTTADAELAAADNVAKNKLTMDFYLAQAAQTLALEQTIARIRSEHQDEFHGIFAKITELEATDSAITTEFTSAFESLDKNLSQLRLTHDKNIAELHAEDEALRTDQEKLALRYDKIEDGSVNLSIASLNANLVAAIKEANANHEDAVKALVAADASRSSVSAEDVTSLAETVTAANKKLEQTIEAAENANAAAVLELKAEDVVLKQADVDATVKANALNIAYMAEDAKLLQRIDTFKATHDNEVAKLDREDTAIVSRIIEMTKIWEENTAELGEALSATVAEDKAAAAKKLQQASAAREQIRTDVKAAHEALEQNVAKARADFKEAFDRIGHEHGSLRARVNSDYSENRDVDKALEERVSSADEARMLLDLRLSEWDADLTEKLRKARDDHANEAARVKAAEAGYTMATEDARVEAIESNNNLEQRINKSIQEAEAANYARQEKLSRDLNAADAQLTARIQAAEAEHTKQLDLTRDNEVVLKEEDVFASLRLDAFKLRLASEDAKLAVRLDAEKASRKSAIVLLEIAEHVHEVTDTSTLANLKALRKQHERAVENFNGHHASMETDLDYLTKEIHDHNVRYETEIHAAEVAADTENAALQGKIDVAITTVQAAVHDRDKKLLLTAASNTQAVLAVHAELRKITDEATAAIKNEAGRADGELRMEIDNVHNRFYEQLRLNDAHLLSSSGEVYTQHKQTHDDLYQKIMLALDDSENDTFEFGMNSMQARDEMAQEVRLEAAETNNLRTFEDTQQKLTLRAQQQHNEDQIMQLYERGVDTAHSTFLQNEQNKNRAEIRSADLRMQTNLEINEASQIRAHELLTAMHEGDNDLGSHIAAVEDDIRARDVEARGGLRAVTDHTHSKTSVLNHAIDDASERQHLANENVAQQQTVGTVNLRQSIRDHDEEFNARLSDAVKDLAFKRSEETAARIAGDEAVDTDINMNLRATSAAATNNFQRKIVGDLAAESAHRQDVDEALILTTSNHRREVDSEKEDRHLGLESALQIVDDTRTKEINDARAEHDADVAALHERDGGLAAAIVARVAAAEERIDGEQDEQAVRMDKLLSDAKAKSAAADAAAGALLKKLQDQSNMILGVGNPSTAACAATTIGLCNVREQLHGGVTGECDTARSSGGWCSYRCNNGKFSGDDGCQPK